MTTQTQTIFVVAGKVHTTLAAAQADQNVMLMDGYNVEIEQYADRDAEDIARDAKFRSDLALAAERNRLIDFRG